MMFCPIGIAVICMTVELHIFAGFMLVSLSVKLGN
jgi:hypothetical protein